MATSSWPPFPGLGPFPPFPLAGAGTSYLPQRRGYEGRGAGLNPGEASTSASLDPSLRVVVQKGREKMMRMQYTYWTSRGT